ncbi:MAG TPA: TRAM domain-containing protein, partial [Candidatus Nanoarchaeia archaeon]|nr:TRAM domain-containing protein [Candidatus Nanoarchaeia archaeon]
RMEDDRDSRGFAKPVQQGDEVEVTIESTGAKGDGVAKVNNFVIIVPGAKEGEKVKVRITRVLRKMAFGEIVGGASEEEASKEETEESSDEEESDESQSEEEPSEESDSNEEE